MKQWTFLNKSAWPEVGPWTTEPDKAQWTDEATGLPCLAVRARTHWCGYVGVPEGHPLFDKERDSYDAELSVHGGITFTGFCQEGGGEELAICHVPDPGQPDRVFWLGFDCRHGFDYAPSSTQDRYSFERQWPMPKDCVYRTLEYVKDQCTKLAGQLANIQHELR